MQAYDYSVNYCPQCGQPLQSNSIGARIYCHQCDITMVNKAHGAEMVPHDISIVPADPTDQKPSNTPSGY